MAVLDLLARDERVRRITLVDPDVYQPHNVARHLFGLTGVGQLKVELAREWLQQRRPELQVQLLPWDLTDPLQQGALREIIAEADLGVCAADNEQAKYHFDRLMCEAGKPWTLGEVLSGGIAGFVHGFVPQGPCYGCVASFLQRSVKVEQPPAPDYAAPGGPIWETTIPASRASIQAIASLHALLTVEMLQERKVEYTTLLFSLQRVPGIFEEAFRTYRYRIARMADCLICQARPTPSTVEELDAALDRAFRRLGTT